MKQFNPEEDLFALLGVSQTTSKREIVERAERLANAAAVLTDPEARDAYLKARNEIVVRRFLAQRGTRASTPAVPESPWESLNRTLAVSFAELGRRVGARGRRS